MRYVLLTILCATLGSAQREAAELQASLEKITAIGQKGVVCAAEAQRLQAMIFGLEAKIADANSKIASLTIEYNEKRAKLIKDGSSPQAANQSLLPLSQEGNALKDAVNPQNREGFPRQIQLLKNASEAPINCTKSASDALDRYIKPPAPAKPPAPPKPQP